MEPVMKRNKKGTFKISLVSLIIGLILTSLTGVVHIVVAGTSKILPVPYIHQTYDTPDDFVGSWACAPTCAVMILAYYGKVPKDPIWVSYPSPGHYSDYGKYISKEYTYDGHTFSHEHAQYTYWVDSDGNTHGCGWATGKGAWGYIWKDSSSSCEACGVLTNLLEYLRIHDLIISYNHYDENSARDLVQQEIDNGRPLIGRTRLTSGGYYVVIVGYEIDAYGNFWYKVNDPFGEKPYGSGCWGKYNVHQPVTYSYSEMGLGDSTRGLVTVKSSTAEQLTVYDFWRKDDPIYADPSSSCSNQNLMPSIRLEMMDHSQSLLSGLLWPYMIPTIIIYGICAFKTHATLGTTIMLLWSLEKHTGSNVLSVTFKREQALKL